MGLPFLVRYVAAHEAVRHDRPVAFPLDVSRPTTCNGVILCANRVHGITRSLSMVVKWIKFDHHLVVQAKSGISTGLPGIDSIRLAVVSAKAEIEMVLVCQDQDLGFFRRPPLLFGNPKTVRNRGLRPH